MGQGKSRGKFARKTAPFLMLVAATGTGTVLASDPCKVTLVQKFTSATDSTDHYVAPRHKHTKATLAAWKVWGEAYLAKHGHPYVPPKRPVHSLHPKSPREQQAMFKFACETFEVPTMDLFLTAELTPEDVPPFITGEELPVLTAENSIPPVLVAPPTTDTTTTDTPFVPYVPIYPPGIPTGGGSPIPPQVPVLPPVVPPTPSVPVSSVPEPSSFFLLGTGMAAILGLRLNGRRGREV